jgi:hypothetical protein
MNRWLMAVIMVAMVGCSAMRPASIPDGYDVDLTPNCEGATWR